MPVKALQIKVVDDNFDVSLEVDKIKSEKRVNWTANPTALGDVAVSFTGFDGECVITIFMMGLQSGQVSWHIVSSYVDDFIKSTSGVVQYMSVGSKIKGVGAKGLTESINAALVELSGR